jgi:hypothetical protein
MVSEPGDKPPYAARSPPKSNGNPGEQRPVRHTSAMSDWTRVEPGPAQAMLEQLSRDGGERQFTAQETDVDCRSLPFYGRYKLYRLTNRATLPAFSLHYLGDGEHFVALNGTANPIYTASERDPLQLAEASVIPYVEFFFSHVQGSEGEIFFVKDPQRTPLLASLDDDQRTTLAPRYSD